MIPWPQPSLTIPTLYGDYVYVFYVVPLLLVPILLVNDGPFYVVVEIAK